MGNLPASNGGSIVNNGELEKSEVHNTGVDSDYEKKRNELSELFDENFIDIIDLIECEDEDVRCSTRYQGLIRKYIAFLKNLTQTVSDLKLFPTKPKDEPEKEEMSVQILKNAPVDTVKSLDELEQRAPRESIRTPFASEIAQLGATNLSSNDDKSKPLTKMASPSKPYVSTSADASNMIKAADPDSRNFKFLLLPVLLGFLHLKIKDYDRAKLLSLACVYFKDFVERCTEFNIEEGTSKIMEQQDLSQIKDINDYEHFKEQRDIRRQHVGELNTILCKLKATGRVEHSLTQCNDNYQKSDQVTNNSEAVKYYSDYNLHNDQHDSKNKKEFYSTEKITNNACFPNNYSEYNLDIPDESISSFDQYVLYKYGRGYLEAKGKLEKRNKERRSQSEDEIRHEKTDSIYSIGQGVGEGFKMIPDERSFYTENSSREKLENLRKSRESNENSYETPWSLEESSVLLTHSSFNKHLLHLFLHKCLGQMETCCIEIQIQHSLGPYFRPCYLEHFRSVTNVNQDEKLYEPVLIK